MAELNDIQKDKVNKLIATYEIDKNDAIGLVTGELELDTYLKNRKISKDEKLSKVTNTDSFIENEGYDVNLIKETKKKVAEKKYEVENSAAADDYSEESLYFDEYTPSSAETLNTWGITTDKDKELPSIIRTKLSFTVPNDDIALAESKNLYKKWLVDEKGYSKELVESLDDQIQFKWQKVGNKSLGFREFNSLIYRTPEELGGDNKWVAANTPSLIPNLGDIGSISGDLLPVATAITGAVIGSFGGPYGLVAGSAGGTFIGEYGRLWIGRHVFDLNTDPESSSYMTDEEFEKYALNSAVVMTGVDLVLTPAMLMAGAAIKKSILSMGKERLTYDSVKKVLKGEITFDDDLIKKIEVARNKIVQLGVPEDLANEYTAISVARALPESGIISKGTKEDKIFARKLEALEKKLTANKVEERVIKKLSGIDDVNLSPKVKDDIMIKVGDEIKSIRKLEIEKARLEIQNAEQTLAKNWEENWLAPEIRQIDELGVVFNNLQKEIKAVWSTADDILTTQAKNIPVIMSGKDSLKLINKLKKTLDVKVVPKKPKKLKKNASVEEVKNYNTKLNEYEHYHTFLKFLNGGVVPVNQTVGLGIFKKAINQMSKGDKLTYSQAKAWHAYIKEAETQLSGKISSSEMNVLTHMKGVLKDGMDEGIQASGNQKLINAHQTWGDLVNNYQGSALTQFADEFKIALKRDGGFNMKLEGNVQNMFKRFVNNTDEGLVNAQKLGNLLQLQKLTTKGDLKGMLFKQQDINKITNALYENYYNKVIPKMVNGKLQPSEMSHSQFMAKFGKNYRLILGDNLYNKFATSNKAAMESFEKSVKFQTDTIETISRTLPGLAPEVLARDNSQAIVAHLFSRMRTNDVGALVKNLEKINPLLLKDIRKVFLSDFITKTKPQGFLDGRILDDFLTEYKPVLDELYSKEFTAAYRDIAVALKELQATMDLVGTPGAATLTQSANRLGLLIDIFAGPLNHKRLILNRVARIHDGFDLGGDSLALLMDYKKFIEAARNKFLGGNYPRILDQLGNSKSAKVRGLWRSLWDALVKTSTLGKYGKWEKPKGLLYNPMKWKTAAGLELSEDFTDLEEKVAASGIPGFGTALEESRADEQFDVDPADAIEEIADQLGITIADNSAKIVNTLITQWKKVFKDDEELKQDLKKKRVIKEEFVQ